MRVCLLLLLLSPATLSAQWRLAVLAGSATTRGDAHDTLDPEQPQLRADHPATWSLALSHRQGALRLGADLHHISADLAEVGQSSGVTTPDVLTAWGLGAEVALRVAGREDGPQLFAGAGATLDRWRFALADDSPRTRLGARASLEAEFPFAQGWSALVRGALSMGPSVFTASELPEGFARQGSTRMGMFFGVARTLQGSKAPGASTRR